MYLLIIYFFINYVVCKENCLNLNVSLTQNIENNGFHRKINWMLELSTADFIFISESKSRLALHLNVSPGMFVNPDEISDLKRLGKLFVHIDRDVNIEETEYEADTHNAFIFLENVNKKIQVVLPVHLRYQLAQIEGKFGKVVLRKPSLLIHIPKEDYVICGQHKTIQGPCDFTNFKQCIWINVTYNALFKEIEMLVPIGNLDHFSIITIITLLLGCIGCMYILAILSTR